jgi:hypothetical protein
VDERERELCAVKNSKATTATLLHVMNLNSTKHFAAMFLIIKEQAREFE